MLALSNRYRYFLYYGKTDFRKGFDGLSGLARNEMGLDPTDGKLLPDTNLVENAIRPTKIGLKNYMFQGNEIGARRAAVLYSLLETCKKNDIDPYEWLTDVYTRIPSHPINKIRELLPTIWKQQKQTVTTPS